ncbi:PD40 domain-containing protein [Flagellimonas allohymeniacidonis]|uniref:WD40-like Beta Propeller Repeat n=1 Tax=Flagellimonas allohymeniacidonis TaxID=2517819 RepID=A0A4Q8QEJ8_9FLAO|nr:PD40 domain-containing protein [Allomuricauda hymeniacidonis]TAI47598.1 hypothetical protein EW142_13110 [Allomuricauda hymeniacidonis]
MKLVKTIFVLAVFLLMISSCLQEEKSNLILLSPEIPKDVPLIFAPDIITVDSLLEGSITFSPEMDEIFFNQRKPRESHNVYTIKWVNGSWTTPQLARFSTNTKYLDVHPRFNPQGNRLYFGSRRPLPDTTETSGFHQWYVDKNENGWGEPVPMAKPLVDRWIMCVTASENGNLYYTSREEGQKPENEGIYFALNQEGKLGPSQKMGKEINEPGTWIAHPYIAPDESYIIYDAERTSIPENGDLYISFNKNGVWSESYSLGPEINTDLSENAATVSPDGKYLFFSRGEEKVRDDGSTYWLADLYWVDFIRLRERIEKTNMK